MFTSEKNSKAVMRTLFIYIGVTLFVGLFSTIYEINSHHVYSAAMVFAFKYPFVFGIMMYLIMRYLPTDKVPGTIPATIYHFGVAMGTVRSIFIGVLDIYGTTNNLMLTIYTILAVTFLIVGLGLYLFILVKGVKENRKKNNSLTVE